MYLTDICTSCNFFSYHMDGKYIQTGADNQGIRLGSCLEEFSISRLNRRASRPKIESWKLPGDGSGLSSTEDDCVYQLEMSVSFGQLSKSNIDLLDNALHEVDRKAKQGEPNNISKRSKSAARTISRENKRRSKDFTPSRPQSIGV